MVSKKIQNAGFRDFRILKAVFLRTQRSPRRRASAPRTPQRQTRPRCIVVGVRLK